MPPMRPPAIEGKDLTSVAQAIETSIMPVDTVKTFDNEESVVM